MRGWGHKKKAPRWAERLGGLCGLALWLADFSPRLQWGVSFGDLGADGFGEFVVVFLRLAGVGEEVFCDGVDYGKEVFGVVAAFVGV